MLQLVRSLVGSEKRGGNTRGREKNRKCRESFDESERLTEPAACISHLSFQRTKNLYVLILIRALQCATHIPISPLNNWGNEKICPLFKTQDAPLLHISTNEADSQRLAFSWQLIGFLRPYMQLVDLTHLSYVCLDMHTIQPGLKSIPKRTKTDESND